MVGNGDPTLKGYTQNLTHSETHGRNHERNFERNMDQTHLLILESLQERQEAIETHPGDADSGNS